MTKESNMTAQIIDICLFNDESHDIIGISGKHLATPRQFGMEASMMHTACYLGYYATYAVVDNELYLKQFTLRVKNNEYKKIDHVEPSRTSEGATYYDLNLPIPYTGEIRLAKDLGVYMGFQKASAYKSVFDLSLRNGHVYYLNDISKKVQEMRGDFKKRYERGDPFETTFDAFRLDMDIY